jgi:hypothetical protein
VVDRGVVDDAMAEQRPVLHQPEHGVLPLVLACGSRALPHTIVRKPLRLGCIRKRASQSTAARA